MLHQDVGKPYENCPHKFLLDLHLTDLKHQYNAWCHQNSSLWGADHCITDILVRDFHHKAIATSKMLWWPLPKTLKANSLA